MQFYNAANQNKSEFEIIFVGPKSPNFDLPSNFKYIYATVKPSQCAYIAYKHARGDYLLLGGDDAFYRGCHLDIYSANVAKYGPDKIFSGRYKFRLHDRKGRCIKRRSFGKRDYRLLYNKKCKKKNTFIVPHELFISKKLWNLSGGIDINFITGFWSYDIIMRLYSMGYSYIYCPETYITEIRIQGENTLTDSYDEDLFYSYWCIKDDIPKVRFGHNNMISLTKDDILNCRITVLNTRSEIVIPYEDRDDIFTVSQGPKGRWL